MAGTGRRGYSGSFSWFWGENKILRDNIPIRQVFVLTSTWILEPLCTIFCVNTYKDLRWLPSRSHQSANSNAWHNQAKLRNLQLKSYMYQGLGSGWGLRLLMKPLSVLLPLPWLPIVLWWPPSGFCQSGPSMWRVQHLQQSGPPTSQYGRWDF